MKCEICQCDPCDCWDMMGYEDEFRGMGSEGTAEERENNELASPGNPSSPEYGNKMETRQPTENGTISSGLRCTCNYTGTADLWDDYIRGQSLGDRNK